MFPVWFLSYRSKDRVAYATVNGQTGKVIADIPVDPKKYVIGSLLLALPIFLLLNLFLILTPGKLLIASAILALISTVIYGTEFAQIARKESGLDDKGQQYRKRYFGTAETGRAAADTGPSYNLWTKPGFWCALASFAAAAAVFILNPASDLIFYGAAILSLAAVLISLLDVIKYYNVLSTRRLPQFDKQGGDDRA